MELFELKDYKLVYRPQTLALKPFKAIWDADKSKDKKMANLELSFVYFVADYKSDFNDILDEEDRIQEVAKAIYGEDKLPYKVPQRINDAIKFYRSRQETVSSRMLDDANTAVSKISTYLRNINTDKLSPRDVKSIAEMISIMNNAVDTLFKIENKVRKELEQNSNLRGQKQRTVFEDGV